MNAEELAERRRVARLSTKRILHELIWLGAELESVQSRTRRDTIQIGMQVRLRAETLCKRTDIEMPETSFWPLGEEETER